MNSDPEMTLKRPQTSRILSEIRRRGSREFDLLPPGLRMEAAFRLSMDACKLRVAGLKAQGLAEPEIHARLSTGRP